MGDNAEQLDPRLRGGGGFDRYTPVLFEKLPTLQLTHNDDCNDWQWELWKTGDSPMRTQSSSSMGECALAAVYITLICWLFHNSVWGTRIRNASNTLIIATAGWV